MQNGSGTCSGDTFLSRGPRPGTPLRGARCHCGFVPQPDGLRCYSLTPWGAQCPLQTAGGSHQGPCSLLLPPRDLAQATTSGLGLQIPPPPATSHKVVSCSRTEDHLDKAKTLSRATSVTECHPLGSLSLACWPLRAGHIVLPLAHPGTCPLPGSRPCPLLRASPPARHVSSSLSFSFDKIGNGGPAGSSSTCPALTGTWHWGSQGDPPRPVCPLPGVM